MRFLLREISACIKVSFEQGIQHIADRVTLINNMLDRQTIRLSSTNRKITNQTIINDGKTTITSLTAIGQDHYLVIFVQRFNNGKHNEFTKLRTFQCHT